MTLDDYREQLRRLAMKADGAGIYNGSNEHASVVMQVMFEAATESVEILANELDAEVYGNADVIRAASTFLSDPDKSLDILIERDLSAAEIAAHPFLKVMRRFPNVELRHVVTERQSDYEFNAAVVDVKSMRFEPRRSSPQAIVAFGRSDDATVLHDVFKDLFENSSEEIVWQQDDHLQNAPDPEPIPAE